MKSFEAFNKLFEWYEESELIEGGFYMIEGNLNSNHKDKLNLIKRDLERLEKIDAIDLDNVEGALNSIFEKTDVGNYLPTEIGYSDKLSNECKLERRVLQLLIDTIKGVK